MAQRPPRATTLDPFKPYAFFVEQELGGFGRVVTSSTILLTNKECPWRCLMCDLWKNTLTETVPPGAIPRQIQFALAQQRARPEQVKLYNSGSFFDSAAIPPADYPEIARTVACARHLIVESHPRLIGEKALRLRDLLSGSLEVAMGLETIHPRVLPRLNKKFDLGHFSRAADFLCAKEIALRAFVLVKPPFLDEQEGVDWAVKSAAFAFSCGAVVVTLIPTRGGNGAMERLRESGEFAPPKLASLERALELALKLRAGRVFADTWDLEKFSDCPVCLPRRRERLQAMNLSQAVFPAIDCPACGCA
jgi:radical SAM enzyme (TIGR01210 family)